MDEPKCVKCKNILDADAHNVKWATWSEKGRLELDTKACSKCFFLYNDVICSTMSHSCKLCHVSLNLLNVSERTATLQENIPKCNIKFICTNCAEILEYVHNTHPSMLTRFPVFASLTSAVLSDYIKNRDTYLTDHYLGIHLNCIDLDTIFISHVNKIKQEIEQIDAHVEGVECEEPDTVYVKQDQDMEAIHKRRNILNKRLEFFSAFIDE